MGYRRRQNHQIDGLITLVLFGVFAACVLSVLLTGAKVYRDLTAEDREAYDRRVCAQYVTTKVRQIPSGDTIEVSEHDGTDVLSFGEEIEGEDYITRIYCYDGWIRELFTFRDAEFFPEDGEAVVQAQAMELGLDDDLLTVELTDSDGAEIHLALTLRGKGAAS